MRQVTGKNIHIHFVGIGGVGMSGIAGVLLSLGYGISGSDIKKSERIEYLRMRGIRIFIGHREANIDGATYIVYTSAVGSDNIEILAAKKNNIPVMQRTQMLAELMRLKKGVAVAGTHGKTTTTGILTTIVQAGGLDPTYIIGGKALNLKEYANVGSGEHLIVEADESDGSFLLLNSIYSIVTNIDYDHMDFYGSKENLLKAFEDFLNKVPFYGIIAVNMDDENIKHIIPRIKKRCVTFGIRSDNADQGELPNVYATNIRYSESGSSFDVFVNGHKLGILAINIPGNHNILNALGAVAISYFMGIDFSSIKKGVSLFGGIERRFEKVMERDGFEVFDDYGHHPTEVVATLGTLRSIRPDKRRIAIFEPHRFSRTKNHWEEFALCFKDVDELYILDIYPASESPVPGITSWRLVEDIKKMGVRANYCAGDSLHHTLTSLVASNVAVITLGAGSIGERLRDWASRC